LNIKKIPERIDKDHRFSADVGEGTLSDIVNLSAVELSDAVKNKVVSCVDVMKSYLAQIDKVNPTFSAIVSLRNRDELLSEAAQKDSELAKGIYHGWMHGFPHAVKDLAATKGTCGGAHRPVCCNGRRLFSWFYSGIYRNYLYRCPHRRTAAHGDRYRPGLVRDSDQPESANVLYDAALRICIILSAFRGAAGTDNIGYLQVDHSFRHHPIDRAWAGSRNSGDRNLVAGSHLQVAFLVGEMS